jgi:predicted nucleic acid-binding protein
VTRVLVDTNVVLDVLLDSSPHAGASMKIWAAVENSAVEGLLAPHTITTIHYLIRKHLGAAKALRTLAAILQVFDVAMVDSAVIGNALELSSPDFEDAATSAAAEAAACDFIVTRDPRGFRGSSVRVLTPEMAAAIFMERK